MGWTKAERYITDYTEIGQYLEEMDGFHDYQIGNLEIKNNTLVRVFVEEVIPGKKLQDSTGKIWEWEFEDIRKFEFECDCAMRLYIDELHTGDEDGEILFELHNGYISVTVEKIGLRVPSDVKE